MPKKTQSDKGLYHFAGRSWDKIIMLLLILGYFLFYPGQNVYMTAQFSENPGKHTDIAIPTPAPYPINTTNIYPGEEVTATGVVIVDVDSGVYIYKRNETMRFSPASTTKILTALVALDAYKLDDVVTVRTALDDGQSMHLVPGERITVENLLYGLLIHSGNDAAFTLAEIYPDGKDAFVKAMNSKAKALHLTESHFTNAMGFDDPDHRMTPVDLSLLALSALTNTTIAKMVAIPQITISDVTHTYFHKLTNINQLLGKIPGVGGMKTGWTQEAGENLVTVVERKGHRIIIVILHSKNRFDDTTRLIDWVFSNIMWHEFKPQT